jgi:hypothetical protein
MRHDEGAGTGDGKIAGPMSKSVICGDKLDISRSQAVPQAQDWHAQRKAAEQTIAALADLFRAAFVANRWEPHRPLARGIHRELVERGILRPEECRLVLGLYVARPMYLKALAAGGARINLAGLPTGEVTAEEMAYAAASVARHADLIETTTPQEILDSADPIELLGLHQDSELVAAYVGAIETLAGAALKRDH